MDKGKSYIAIVFSNDKNLGPKKYTRWINDYTLRKHQFQRFIKNTWPNADYANIYCKETNKFIKRIDI